MKIPKCLYIRINRNAQLETFFDRLKFVFYFCIIITLLIFFVLSCLWFPYWLFIGRNVFKDIFLIGG